MLNRYPVLKKDVHLRHHGETARVVSGKRRFRAFTVNRHGGELLCRCSGDRTLRSILAELSGEKSGGRETANILRFLGELENMQVLEYRNTPDTSPVDAAGSRECITPQVISLELTERCNFHCRYCYQEASDGRHGCLDDPLALLAYFHGLDTAGVELTGGEPLLHPRFSDIVAFVMSHFELLGLITNGSLLREHHLERLTSGPCRSAVQVCLDGHTSAMVEATTGVVGSFEMEVSAIRRVKDFGILLRVGMVVDAPEKIAAMEPTLRLARDLGADSFIAHPFVDFGRGASLAQCFSVDDYRRLNDTMAELQERYRGFFAREMEAQAGAFLTMDNCGGGHRAMTVDWRGRLKPCPMIPADVLNLGYWADLESSDSQRKARAYYRLHGPKREICGDCTYLYYCQNCVVRALRAGKIEESCRWREKNRELIRVIRMPSD